MRIRTMVGATIAGAAAAAVIVGGVAYATADEDEPTVRIVTEREVANVAQPGDQPREDCPDRSAAPSASETGL